MACVEFRNVYKSFVIKTNSTTLKGSVVDWIKRRRYDSKQHPVLRDCSFEVNPGETFAIIGPNGTGKSTILKLVASINQPDAGVVNVHGKVAALLEVGAGFQPELTGRENVFLYGSILGMSRKTMQACYDDIVEFSEVGEYIDMPVRTYSSGMYMRLAFAVAIHVEPEILVVDEVLAVGDEQFQKKCLDKIRDLRQRGVTILFVSHDMSAVRNIADRVMLLQRDCSYTIGVPATQVAAYLGEDVAATIPNT